MDLLLWRHAEAEDGDDDLKRRLLTDAIWIDFPGRQIYR